MSPETRPFFLPCTANGTRFLMTTNSEASEGESAPVTVVLNWAAGLKNRRDVTAKDQPATATYPKTILQLAIARRTG
jgi:hypothetical protein